MRTKLFLSLFLVFCFGAFQVAQAASAQPVNLRVGDQKNVFGRDLTVQFVSVLDDSRCPRDVRCVSAGNATIRIKVRRAFGPWQTFDIKLNGNNSTVSFRNYRIDFTSLTPYPRSNIRINRNGYRATLNITR
jgi:hypothetical protein